MAISVAFGVLFATFVTLILVPVLYFIAKDLERFVESLWSESPSGGSPAQLTERERP
jgi:hypothetical protein